jgi:enoyl-CoA hydratase/carnithine racemase
MNAAFIRLGLSACDMGVSYFLPRVVGRTVASELMLTGRFINAQRALATGLVSEVVADDQLEAAAQPYIDEMLMTSPMGLRLTKEGLNLAIDAPSLEAAMAIENRNQVLCARTEDFAEGLRAFMEKRRPNYRDS